MQVNFNGINRSRGLMKMMENHRKDRKKKEMFTLSQKKMLAAKGKLRSHDNPL